MGNYSTEDKFGKDAAITLFKAYPARGKNWVRMVGGPVLVLAADPVPLTFQIESLRKQGRDVVHCTDIAQFQDLLGVPTQRWSLFIIEIEGFGGITAVIGKLLMLRLEHPDLPIILASTRMQADDFTLERLPICDVSLALPCTVASLNVAVQNALMNNLAWQMRLDEIEKQAEATEESRQAIPDAALSATHLGSSAA